MLCAFSHLGICSADLVVDSFDEQMGPLTHVSPTRIPSSTNMTSAPSSFSGKREIHIGDIYGTQPSTNSATMQGGELVFTSTPESYVVLILVYRDLGDLDLLSLDDAGTGIRVEFGPRNIDFEYQYFAADDDNLIENYVDLQTVSPSARSTTHFIPFTSFLSFPNGAADLSSIDQFQLNLQIRNDLDLNPAYLSIDAISIVVPEPHSLLLLALGVTVLASRRRHPANTPKKS